MTQFSLQRNFLEAQERLGVDKWKKKCYYLHANTCTNIAL